jgi:Glycosyltransferase
VQPSLSEGHPLAVLEAMSLGLPVIASAVGGIPELFHGEHYGTLAQAGSSQDLYLKMLEWLRQPDRFRQKASVGREFIRKAHSIQSMARNYINIYRQMTGQGDYAL